MVKAEDLGQVLRQNLGARAMTFTPDPQAFAHTLVSEIRRYDAQDIVRVRERVREQCGRDRIAAEFIVLYEEVLAEYKKSPPPNRTEEAVPTASYVRELLLTIKREQDSFHHSKTYQLFESLLGLPLVGKMSLKLAQKLSGKTLGRR